MSRVSSEPARCPQLLKSDQKLLSELRENFAATKLREAKAVKGLPEAAGFQRRRRFLRDVGRAGAAATGERVTASVFKR